MSIVLPFRGCRYNPDLVADLGSTLCPPYDMIGPALKESLENLSPYNAVHLEGGEQPDPVDPEAGYRTASATFQRWLADGVLRREPEARFYLMRHSYPWRGGSKSHLALFGGVRVEEYDRMVVLPHEFTREPAVMDRVALLDFCRAQFSPIMTLYRDGEGDLRSVYREVMSRTPVLDVHDPTGDAVTLWEIVGAGEQERITRFFADRPLFLADGHHRYEAALRHGRQQSEPGVASGAPAHEYVMMALVEFDDPGLMLLPYHRTLGGMSPEQLSEVRDNLDETFEVQPVHLDEAGTPKLLEQVNFLGKDGHALAMIGPRPGEAYLMMLRPGIDWRSWGSLAVSEAWILDEKALKPVLGEPVTRYVDYVHDADEAVQQVNDGTQQLAFLLKPFPLDAFEEIVGAGQRLPSKSTFFYPKLPTGLVINQLEGPL